MHVPDTVAAALREAAQRLSATSDTARLDAELLMAHALGVSRSDMLLRHQDAPAPTAFSPLVYRRVTREPIAYILGEQEFLGRNFRVSPAVLIPRSDSEAVVLAALDAAPDAGRVLDLGTGTGALLLSVLAERPDATGIGIDASAQALEIAKANTASFGLANVAQLLLRDWSKAGWAADLGRFDLVLANPPYVEEDALLDADVRDFEPASALFAGPDGLDDYRLIIPQLSELLTENGIAVLEIGSLQAAPVSEIAVAHGFMPVTQRDLAGRDRILVLRQKAWQRARH